MSEVVTSLFATCVNGHPTRIDRDFIYGKGGSRQCRACAESSAEAKAKKRRGPSRNERFIL